MGHLGWHLLPPDPNVCQACAVKHEPDAPHDAQSLCYQYTFYDEHGRWPTWADAMAHCSPEVQEIVREVLAEHGVQ